MNAKILQNINMILHINKLKNKKKPMIISTDAGKTSDKIQHPFRKRAKREQTST